MMHRWLPPVVLALLSTAASAADRPNVLLICVDDLKPTLGCYGDDQAVTPNIDRLADRGVLFLSAYCNQAVCSPSRNSLMTGMRPQTLGVYDLATHFRRAAPDVTTMTQHFLNHGYDAQGLGKILHVGHGNIDDKASWSTASWRPKSPGYALPSSRSAMTKDKSGKVRGPATESADVPDEFYADGEIAREAITRLGSASQAKDKPFFLAVGFMKPHLPFVAPKKYWDLHKPESLPMPTTHQPPTDAPTYAATNYGELLNYSDMDGRDANEESTTRHLIHGYYAATSYMDAQVGKVLDAVDQFGLADNTIIVLWGDHGWHLGDHGMWCKHTNYEQAARIPVIVSAPGHSAAAKTSAMIETVDVFPTLCELAKIDPPQTIDGLSFVAALSDPSASARPYVTHVYPRGDRLGRAIRNTRYRMVEWKEWDTEPTDNAIPAEFELYDYVADPHETRNLAAKETKILASMRAELAKHPAAKPAWKSDKKTTSPAASNANKRPAGSGKPAANSQPFDRKAAFAKRDVDQDGYLSRDEFLKAQPDAKQAPNRFPKFDKNNDGKLSAEEFIQAGR